VVGGGALLRVLMVGCVCALTACASDLLIRNVTVIDVVAGARLPRRSILIHDDQIVAVGTRVKAPTGARMVNAAGQYAIPGLWDMHVHLWYQEHQFPLFLANGVTGVRDMGSDFERVKGWRREIADGKLLGPHIETCGPAVDGAPSDDPKLPILVAGTPVEAREVFDKLDAMHVDFVKVLSRFNRDSYFALLERARKWYTPVAGHVPDAVTVWEAIDARQKSMEHLFGVLLACSSEEEQLRKARVEARAKRDQAAYSAAQLRVLDTFDRKRAGELFERMARFESRQVPTLVMLRRMYFIDTEKVVDDPALAYISPAIRKQWEDPREDLKRIPPDVLARLAREYEMLTRTLKPMRRAGVMIMAGSDTGDPYTYAGFDLHRELELLTDAGLTPLEALRSATLEPAKYLDAQDSIGAVEQGKTADIVLLDADPLADIRNTRKIAAVVLAGKYLSRAKLAAMLQVRK
jgi:imidazolonepropionase-like amidohydrolase